MIPPVHFLYFFNSQDVRCDYIIVVVIRLEVIYSPLEVELPWYLVLKKKTRQKNQLYSNIKAMVHDQIRTVSRGEDLR